MNRRDEFVKQMQAKLEEWNAVIDQLEAKARQQKAQASQDYHEQLAQLKDKRAEAADKLAQLQQASDNAWESLKSGTEQIWDEVTRILQDTKKTLAQ